MSSLSAYRLKETAQIIAGFADDFVVLKSKSTLPVTQYYVVPSNWHKMARTQPLAHVNVTDKGKIILKVFQPDLFDLSLDSDQFKTQINTLLH